MDASLLASKSFAFDEAGRTNKRDGVHIYIQGVRIAITEVAPIDDIDLLVFQTGFFFFSYFFLYLYTGNINPFLKSDSLVGKERRPKKQGVARSLKLSLSSTIELEYFRFFCLNFSIFDAFKLRIEFHIAIFQRRAFRKWTFADKRAV